MTAILYVILAILAVTESFRLAEKSSAAVRISKVSFQKDDENNNPEKKSFLDGLKRFIPGVVRARLEKTYNIPQEEPGNIYEVRLLNPSAIDRRHVITRIMRFFPGITWETAEEVVSNAIKEGFAVIRIFNSMVKLSSILSHIFL